MAQKLDFSIPFNDLIQYVPQNLRNPVISGLIDNLFNRQMTHDESVPMFGYVGRRPTLSDDRTLRIPQPTVERDLNAVTPVLSFDVGSQKYAFTTQDLINKAAALGIDTSTRNWLYSQGSNYLPPIDISKFANFYQYYWVAQALDSVPALPWNSELLPEYYVIAPPAPTDLDKLNVEVATTGAIVRTGTGFQDQSFVLTFTAANTFTLAATAALPAGYSVTSATATNGATQTVAAGIYTCTLPPATLEQTYENTFYFNVTGPAGLKTLVEFTVSRDPIYNSSGVWTGSNETFVAGDVFNIDTVFLSSAYNISYSILPGIKGKIAGVKALSEYQIIDGVQLTNGMRVLVKNNSAADNGIFLVGPQGFTRTPDYDGATMVAGARVWVRRGTVNGGKLFTSGAGNSWPAGVTSISNTNDWQEGNFWVHGDDLLALGLTRADVVQASRPIIEYSSAVKLNSFVSGGLPADSGSQFKQVKSEFNQLPMFDLYRYDGTHSGYVSSIFYYEEDPTAELDLVLQKRVKLSPSSTADYIFNHGLQDEEGQLLFYKSGSTLKSIWHAGHDTPTIVDFEFVGAAKGKVTKLVPTTSATPQTWTLTYTSIGTFSIVGSVTGPLASDLIINTEYADPQFSIIVTGGDIPFALGEQFIFTISAGPVASTPTFVGAVKGSLSALSATTFTQQQVWTLEATSPTTFKVSSSKLGDLPTAVATATVGTPYINADISLTITAGALAYDVGDVFHVRVGNLEFPRYIQRDATGSVLDVYGGPALDTAGVGAYEAPRTFSHNPYNSARDEVLEGTLYSHFRSILQNQLDTTAPDYAFGGSIKNWSEQHTLLASLLMQRDSTPISLIDYAQNRYDAGLNAISDIFKTIIVQYFVSEEVVIADGSPTQQQRITRLVDHILSLRASDYDVRTVLFDTTSGVTGIPITLPQMGLAPLVTPVITFDNVLGRDVLVHHDGHKSVLTQDDIDFRRTLLSSDASFQVTLSDGSSAPAVGSFTATPPASPFNGQLWIRPDDGDSFMFVYDGGTWQPVNIADTLNSVLLEVEARLHAQTNPNVREVDYAPLLADPAFVSELRAELFTFAALNGLLPLGSDYVPGNPLTWNYSSASTASFPPLSTPTVPARWFNILRAHQATVPGVIQTERPNLEPWKLFGFPTLQAWWSTLSPAQQLSYMPYAEPEDLQSLTFTDVGYVRLVKTTGGVTTLSGLPIIDGVQVNAGDRLLIQNDASPANNGLWIAASGTWTRDTTPLTLDCFVTVAEGVTYARTQWVLSQAVATINVDPVLFKQARYWSDALWADVQSARPTLRLSVNTVTDQLLPPYVNSSAPQSVNALTTTIPVGVSNSYQFGEDGPVETVWKNTLEFRYSLAKAMFRHDPLLLLGFAWGFNWVEVDGLLYDALTINTPGHKSFKLHGEPLQQVQRSASALTLTSATGASPVDVTLTYDAYEVVGASRYQNFSVKTATGYTLGYVREGQAAVTLTGYGITLTGLRIEDSGVPFRTGDKFRITADAAGTNLLVTFIGNPVHHFHGLGQIFTNALRSSAIDTTDSFAIDAYRNWDVNMGYRAAGLVSTDQLTIRTDYDTLSDSSYTVLLKKNEYARDLWLHALRVTVEQFGTAVAVGDALAPPESTDQYGSIVNRAVISDPSQMALNGEDWVFRVEGYNPRYTTISYYELNPAGEYMTFNVLEGATTKTEWKNYSQVLSTQTTTLPVVITGLQNLVTFLFGYSKYIADQGWAFGVDQTVAVDATTGRVRGWQLEIEKLLDTCYRGLQFEQGHILNPFIDEVWINHPAGLLAEFKDATLFDIRTDAAIFDVGGVKFNSEDITVIRGNEQSRFSTAAPMYSAHAQINEYEHLIIFDNYVEESTQSGVLYHPFSGSRTVTYKFDGRRQARTTFRPEFGGHYLVGNEVRQNLQASTDNITKFFDANHVYENSTTSRHALALLGFNDKAYFNDLDISDFTQFNFWRGLIQMKGTNMSIDAYLNNGRFIDAKIDEYWAYKVAEYGDARQRTFPELKIRVSDTVQQFTLFQFDAATGEELPSFTQIASFDEARWVSIDDLNQETYFKAEVVGSFSRTTTAVNEVIQLPFIADSLVGSGFTQLNSTTVVADGGPLSIVGYGAATPRYNPLKLLNYVDDELVEEIPFWHPAIEQHSPVALESINIISSKNPARYNYSTEVANNNSYDPLRPWGPKEVGRVWFDTTNLAYIPYYDPFIFSDRLERLSRWGTIADYATIDVYEWVESTVPPSEFNALAAEQAGDADLSAETKAAGEVALLQTYARDRVWWIRPVAWSRSSVPDAAAHPQFSSTFDSILHIRSDYVSLEAGLFSDYGITAGMRLGEWNNVSYDQRPLSEFIVTSNFTKHLELSGAPLVNPIAVPAGSLVVGPYTYPYAACAVEVSVKNHTDRVGPLLFSTVTNVPVRRSDADGVPIDVWDTPIQLKVTEVDSGDYDIVTLYTVTSTVAPTSAEDPGTRFFDSTAAEVIELTVVGLTVRVTVTTSGTYQADSIRNAIVAALGGDLVMQDAVQLTEVVPWNGVATELTNNPDDTTYDPALEWRAWSVPTQAELTADTRQPNAAWKPYLGEFYKVPPTTALVQDAIAYAEAPLTLNDGTVIERYDTTWDVWRVLKNTTLTAVQTTLTGNVVLTHTENIDATATSVYVNGIAQLAASYSIVGPDLTVSNVAYGSTVVVIIRHYEPSAEELEFDPAVADDLSYQQHYKEDYEYVSHAVRDSDGTPSSTLYYFWVKNKTTAARGKKLSVQAITQALRDGPTNYLTFQNLKEAAGALPYRYDAISLSGMSYAVTKDDTFKLRFTRNFTLRDDPQELDLKDTHTEWMLLRPGQRTPIPEALWRKLTDALAGEDISGNAVPALRRVLYDERNGTTTRFGFGAEQTLAPQDLLISSVTYTIVNTQLTNTNVPPSVDGVYPPDFLDFLDFDAQDEWFATPAAARQTMTDIWTKGKPTQINEIFFAALNDILANNLELTDIFKTSRLSAYSIKIAPTSTVLATYE